MTGRILIAEAHWLVAGAAQMALETCGFHVVGVARTEEQAVVMAREHRPEAVVSNLWLARGGNGVTAARRYIPEIGCTVAFLPPHVNELRAQHPPPCLCVRAWSLTGDTLVDLMTTTVRWRREGILPTPLPPGVLALGQTP